MIKRRQLQKFKDSLATVMICFGGMSVILALVMVMFYLLWVTWPTLVSPQADIAHSSAGKGTPISSQPLYLDLEKRGDQGFRVDRSGKVVRMDAQTGEVLESSALIDPQRQVQMLAKTRTGVDILAMVLDDNRLIAYLPKWHASYVDDKRVLDLSFDLLVKLDEVHLDDDQVMTAAAIDQHSNEIVFAYATSNNKLMVHRWTSRFSFLTGEDETQFDSVFEISVGRAFDLVLVNLKQNRIHVFGEQGDYLSYSRDDNGQWNLLDSFSLLMGKAQITDVGFLAGDASLLVADSSGHVGIWFEQPGQKPRLRKVRSFENVDAPISVIEPERDRRGFLVGDQKGRIHAFYSLTSKKLLTLKVASEPILALGIGAGNKKLLVESNQNHFEIVSIDNPHPEISFDVLTRPVHYEGYQNPSYMWQSSSAESDFEPKLSLVPLVMGSFKAAFYGMLLAIPLALLGAIYTAQFMGPRARGLIKPGIEVMEALPTVILGFIAGLWLAPIVEENLIGTVLVFVMIPLGIVALIWPLSRSTSELTTFVNGAEFIILIPYILLLAVGALFIGEWVENAFFSRDMPQWLYENLDIDYRQRNAFIVGIAIGFAVIPTIFSISEDALFNVPKGLINGSLALGASNWQTLIYVILPTASPAIFSAVMIGLGRAIGETMIVLMATGNTPIMDFSIFEGMRTLSANLAIELPESEVGGSHFRLLFLSALVLFVFAFILNALAEFVRQRLRTRYGRL